jgi:hypothetical protein
MKGVESLRFCSETFLLLDAMKGIKNQIVAFCRLGSTVLPIISVFTPSKMILSANADFSMNLKITELAGTDLLGRTVIN